MNPIHPSTIADRARRAAARKIMPQGDTMVAGWRLYAWVSALATYGPRIDFVGPNFTSGGTNEYRLGDWDNAGFTANRIEQVQARAQADVATYRPEYIMVQLGTYNLSTGETAASMLARIGTLIDTNWSGGGNFLKGQAVSTLPPWNATADDVATRAAREAQRVLFNQGLAEVCRTHGAQFVDCGGSLTTSQLAADGIVPSSGDGGGYDALGTAWARVLPTLTGISSPGITDLFGRPYAVAPLRPSLLMPSTGTARVTIGASEATRIGSGSFVIRVRYRPTALPASTHVIIEGTNLLANGWLLNQFGARLIAYCRNGGAPAISADLALVQDVWHDLVFVGDTTGAAPELRLYCNGQFLGRALQSWNVTVTEPVYIGTSADLSGVAPGYVNDLVIAKDSVPGFRVPTLRDIIAAWRDGKPFAGESVRYPLREGVGSTVTDALGNGASGAFSLSPGPSWGTIAEPSS